MQDYRKFGSNLSTEIIKQPVMRHHPPVPGSGKLSSALPAGKKPVIVSPILGDSLEAIELYHREKAQVLEKSLQQLNLLENAKEIAFICREVMVIREKISAILKRKFKA